MTNENQGGEALMTDMEVRQWIDACNHEPARNVLRKYLELASPPALQPSPAANAKPVDEDFDEQARIDYLRASRDSAADRAHTLYRALVEVRDCVETYPLDDSQTCMCGSPVEGHNVGSGHAPVSQADHAISLIVEAIDKALGVAAIPNDALIGAGRPDDYEGPDVGMHDTEIVEDDND